MFLRTTIFQKRPKNPLTCSRRRKVQKISPRHQSKPLKLIGVNDRSFIIRLERTEIEKVLRVMAQSPNVVRHSGCNEAGRSTFY